MKISPRINVTWKQTSWEKIQRVQCNLNFEKRNYNFIFFYRFKYMYA